MHDLHHDILSAGKMNTLHRQPFLGLQRGQSKHSRCLPPVASSNGNGVAVQTKGATEFNLGVKTTDIYGTTAVLGPVMNAGGAHTMPEYPVEPVSPEVQAIIDEQGIDFEISGLKYLNNEGRVRSSKLPNVKIAVAP